MKIFKEYIKGIVPFAILALVVVLCSTVVYAATWQYAFPTSVVDNSSTTRTYYPVILGYGGQQLIDAGYVDADGLDTNMQIGSADILYMMCTDNVTVLIPSLPSDGQVTTTLYTGYAPDQTIFPVIVGDGGYVSIANSSTLELGNNFEVELDGYLDTSSGADKNLIYKEDAFRLYVSGDQAITCNITTADESITATGVASGNHTVKVTTTEGITSLSEQYLCTGYGKYVSNTFDPHYIAIDSSDAGASDLYRMETEDVYQLISTNGTIKDMQVELSPTSNWDGADSWKFTLYVNDAPTSLSVNITATSVRGSNFSDEVSLVAGDEVYYKAEGSGDGTVYPHISARFIPDIANEGIFLGHGQSLNANSTTWAKIKSGRAGNVDGADEYKVKAFFPTTGTVKNLYVATNSTPGAGAYMTFTVKHYDVSGDTTITTALSANVSGGNQTANDTIHTVDVDIGDAIWIEIEPSVLDPVNTGDFGYGLTFLADNEGEQTILFGFSSDNPSVGNNLNAMEGGEDNDWSNNYDYEKIMLHGCVAKKFYVWLGVAPGAGNTVRYSIERNESDLLHVDISDTSTTGNNTVDTLTFQQYDYTTIQFETLVGTPTGPNYEYWSVVLYAQGGAFKIYVDDVLKDTATEGFTVLDNDNGWTIMQNNSVTCLTSLDIEAYEVQRLWYEPNAMISGVTVPDRTVNSNHGTIHWGNNTDVTIVHGTMLGYEGAVVTSEAVGEFEMPTAGLPETWFARGENVANLPFYNVFNPIAVELGMPVQTIYFWGIIGIAFGLALFLIMFTRSALLGVIALTIVLFVGSSMTIIPMWIPFCVLIIDVLIMFLYRQVSY